ncbi:hypothetical protein MTO96_001668 [Rhipicephalus appendiculatus]
MLLSTCCHIVLIVGLLWPVWDSYNAIDAKNTGQEERWLKYWCLLGSFLVLDNMLAMVLSGFPETNLGGFIRLIVLVGLQMYASQTPELLYEEVFRRQMKLWEPDLDKFLKTQ